MIITLQDLVDVCAWNQDVTIVLTSGTFDLLHVGHVRYLEAVKAHGDIVVVLLSGDARIKARKGDKRPIIPEDDRAMMLDALKVVDYVLIDPATAPPDQIDPVHAQIVSELQPNVYATDGLDIRFKDLMDPSRLVIVPRAESGDHASTSAIIERIAELYR